MIKGIMQMKVKKFLCCLLALSLCVAFIPAVAFAEGEIDPIPHGYLTGMTLNRTSSDSNQIYMLSDGLPYTQFSFVPTQAEYNIMLVDAGKKADQKISITAILNNDITAALIGKFTNEAGANIGTTGREYENGQYTYTTAMLNLVTNVKMDSDLYTVHFETGVLESGTPANGVLADTDTYTLHFYRKATLSNLTVTAGETTLDLTTAFDAYETAYAVANIPVGTTSLAVTAPAYTQTDTVVKYDDGSGNYVAGTAADSFMLDLTDYTPDAEGKVTVPFKLDYTGSGSGVDGYYTLTLSMEEGAEWPGTQADNPIPHGYLTGMTLNRTSSDSNQIYMLSDGLPYTQFSFVPTQAEYDIMLVDAGKKADQKISVTATLNNGITAALIGKFTNEAGANIGTTGREYENGQYTYTTAMLNLVTNVKMDSDLYTVHFETGVLESGTPANGVLTDTDTYTLHFYRKATLSNLAVAYGDGTAIELLATFVPYETAYAVENVAAGTTSLVVTAPAYTQTDTVVKYDDGSGSYVAGTTADSFTVDLTQYTPDADGKVTVPFMLDYTGSGSGVDGYYTLTVSFAETPAIDFSVSGAGENSETDITYTDDGYAMVTVSVGSTDITLTDTAEENTFIITSTDDVPSVVLVKDADDNYTRRTVTTEEGVHKVSITAGESVVVGILGDANGDGELNTRDTTLILRTLTYNGSEANSSLEELIKLILDADGNGTLAARDVTLMLRFLTYHGTQSNSSLNW